MMIAEAGPRVWRDAGPAENTGKGETGKGRGRSPELVEGTVLLELAYDLPAVLPKLLEGWTEVPQAPERRVKLLVARSPHGRVAVARADAAVASVVELADGRSEEHTSELQSPCNLVCRIIRSEEHTSEIPSPCNIVCRLLLDKKKIRSVATPPREEREKGRHHVRRVGAHSRRGVRASMGARH